MNAAAGGSALSTLGLIEQLRQHGIDSCVVCHDRQAKAEADAVRDAARGNILFTPLYYWTRKIRSARWKRPLIELRQLWRTGCTRGSTSRVMRFARAQQVDLVHSNALTVIEGGLASRRLGLPHVWHVRELIGPGEPFRLLLEGPRLGRFLARHASVVVANSDVTADRLRDWLAPTPRLLETVWNGIDVRAITPRDSRDNGPPVVGMVANLTSQMKKHALFIEAAARVDRSIPAEFRIYGYDPSEGGRRSGGAYVDGLLDRIRAHGLGDRVTFAGHRPTDQIMSRIAMLVHPCEHESFGRAVVEAMAAGLPVVGVSGGGVGAIVVDNRTGLLVAPDDPDQMARAIEQLLKNPELRKEMGSAGRKRAVDQFSLEASADGILKAYETAMARPLAHHGSPLP
jgi:glycosyltransferase involved in cell wall biosynthesis